MPQKNKTTGKRRKAKLAVAKVHSKISRIREDFLHKLSRKIVNENQVIVVENLAVKNMVKNHNLAKSISDSEAKPCLRASAGWGVFCTMLKYKAASVGKVYLEINRFFPSTHLCSETLLSIPKMDKALRMFDCPHCGNRHDRDINTAINIRNVREAFPKGRLTDFGVGNQRFAKRRECKTLIGLDASLLLMRRLPVNWEAYTDPIGSV